jgi:tRNA G18 (ribose-2'-O)-methylase SpoU
MAETPDSTDPNALIDRITPIHDRDDPRVAVYLDQKDAWLRARHNPAAGPGVAPEPTPGHGLFMAEGSLVVEHLLASAFPVESVLVAERRVGALAELLGRIPPEVPVFSASRAVMEAITGFDIHRGLLACGRRLPPRDPMDVARACRGLIVLEDLANHDNVGSVFRSAAVLAGGGPGGVGVLLSPRCCDPLYRKALRVSMGHALRVSFATVDDWPGGLAGLGALGYQTFALDPGPGAVPIDRACDPPPARPALVFGAEGAGLSPVAREAAGRTVRIPQAPGVDSLNIAVAAAVAIHRFLPPAV